MNRETLHGVIQGDSIHLDQPSHFPPGTQVEVVVSVVGDKSEPDSRLARLYGAWKDEGETLDASVEWSRQQRKVDRRPQDP